MPRLHILEIDSGLEAHAIRAAAEYWSYDVRVTWVGNSSQVIETLSRHPAEILLLSCHGRSGEILLPEIDADIKAQLGFLDTITPNTINDSLQVKFPLVFSTGCQTGTVELASAFGQRGTKQYLAPIDFPEGDLTLKVVLEWLYLNRNFDGSSPPEMERVKSLAGPEFGVWNFLEE